MMFLQDKRLTKRAESFVAYVGAHGPVNGFNYDFALITFLSALALGFWLAIGIVAKIGGFKRFLQMSLETFHISESNVAN